MARTGRPKAALTLSEAERSQLVSWCRRATSAQALALRAKIVLACADGADNKTVAAQLSCNPVTVGKWRARFIERRLDGLVDAERPGRPASITPDQIRDVLVATLESRPADATHWSRKSMAERSGLSESTVGRIWRRFGLQPHRTDGVRLSTDSLSVERLADEVDPP